MKSNVDILVLGAGIAGLGAAHKAKSIGRNAVVYEANASAGGLLDNFEVQGFRFDNAVHLSFAKEEKVREIFDKTPYFTHPADSLNFEEDKWLKHPVQNNLFPLAVDDKIDLIKSFLNRGDELQGNDYESWLRHQYGNAISERFPLRYTKKYWQTEAKNLSTTWIGNRMRRAKIDEILEGTLTNETPNTYYTKEMRYPKNGGYKAFIQPLIDEANIQYGKVAVKIDLSKKTVLFNDGSETSYQTLVNTLPLPYIASICDTHDAVTKAAEELECTSIDLISVGFSENIIKDLWFYIYDEDILASRAYSPSIKSPNNVPEGCSSLQFEIYNPSRTSQHTVEVLKENVSYALNKMKISDGSNILFLHHKHLKWGNVVFKHHMEANRQIVYDFLKENDVLTCGRFGLWDYLWSNQAFMSGYELDFGSARLDT